MRALFSLDKLLKYDENACFLPQILPWKQVYLTYKWVAFAGEGWELPIRDIRYPNAMTKFQHKCHSSLSWSIFRVRIICHRYNS